MPAFFHFRGCCDFQEAISSATTPIKPCKAPAEMEGFLLDPKQIQLLTRDPGRSIIHMDVSAAPNGDVFIVLSSGYTKTGMRHYERRLEPQMRAFGASEKAKPRTTG